MWNPAGMETSRRDLWQADALTLAAVGRAIGDQDLDIVVRLPPALAARAVAAWERDDGGDPVPDETCAARLARGRAAALALLGAAISDRGVTEAGEAVVRVHAWAVGMALDAADTDDPPAAPG